MADGPRAFFLPAADGQRYCIYHAAQGVTRGMVLQAAPFAEELNKTRRMAALQARALAAAGHAVLQIDLLGCGDSSGDFGDARWPLWIQDLLLAHRWLAGTLAAHGALPLWIWGIRAGCLLAADAARALDQPCHLLFWQPSFADGTMQLQQFLRLRLAADMLAAPDDAGRARGAMDALRRQLAAGETLQVAGYALHPDLAAGLQASRLVPPPAGGTARQLVWMEVGSAAQAALSPFGKRTLSLWQQAGWQVEGLVAQGPAFWQSAEIKEAPALLEATVAALAQPSAETMPA
ncbi:hydrolase 2, exosortase A system-associated [Pseudorhodoferax sp. Leaf274]|uniref:hydrolase 2, exosortase A system-associated n=1 Tax=Pseudorhodoferax sp. Leaf274 TaxID=1736318 RepID=UPI001F320E15|nr:hydrolase 2, exosortase A system-associated [Pseudorhodoferax sp. Leaf274]